MRLPAPTVLTDPRPCPRLHPLAAMLLLALATPALAASGDASGADATDLPTLVVSASKRAQTLQDVDGAADVVDRARLERAQVRSTGDLPKVLPGLRVDASGSLLFPVLTLRGVTSAQDFYNPALSVYVDGVPQLPIYAWQNLLDLERVELLRGPQGTLYGKSAQGGVLNLVSRQPGDAAHVQLKAGASGRGGHLLQAAVSGPLLPGLLYGGLALSDDNAPGDLRNGATGRDDQGGSHSRAGRATLRLTPTDAPWEASAVVARDCTEATQDLYVPFDDLSSRVAYVNAGMPEGAANPHMRRCVESQSLSAVYHRGDWRLTASASHQHADITRRFALGPYDSVQPETWRQDVQELRLASEGQDRRWDGVFGLYRQALQQDRRYLNDLPAYGMAALDSRSHNSTRALAAYADLTWHVTDAFDLGAGVRGSRDEADTRFAGSTLNFTTFAQDAFAGSAHTEADTWLGRLSAGYRFDDAWRAYANLAQGYKPGGYNLAPSSAADAAGYARERSLSYELGLRYDGTALSGRVALYQVDTDDAQLYRGDAASGTQSLHNVGDTRARGVEAGLQWEPSTRWTLALDAQATDATFRRYDDPVYCAGCDGNRVPYVPRYAASASVTGHFDSALGRFEPRLALRRSGALYFDTANSLRQDAYSVLDAAISWRPRPAYDITLYANNLSDRHYRTYAFSSTALGAFAQVAAGRTVGITFGYDL